jgi:hypothetical protein
MGSWPFFFLLGTLQLMHIYWMYLVRWLSAQTHTQTHPSAQTHTYTHTHTHAHTHTHRPMYIHTHTHPCTHTHTPLYAHTRTHSHRRARALCVRGADPTHFARGAGAQGRARRCPRGRRLRHALMLFCCGPLSLSLSAAAAAATAPLLSRSRYLSLSLCVGSCCVFALYR